MTASIESEHSTILTPRCVTSRGYWVASWSRRVTRQYDVIVIKLKRYNTQDVLFVTLYGGQTRHHVTSRSPGAGRRTSWSQDTVQILTTVGAVHHTPQHTYRSVAGLTVRLSGGSHLT